MTLDASADHKVQLLPHVAAAMAIYGDANGKYESWLKANDGDYKSEIWWFLDQPGAVQSKATKRGV
jgi:hypothetical protein